MQVDPQVNRLKFDEELARLRQQQSVLEAKRIFLLKSEYPAIDLLFVPRHPLEILCPTLQVGAELLQRVSMQRIALSAFAPRAFKAHFDLTDYDLRAPSLEFRDAWNDQPLEYGQMSWAHEFEQQRGSHMVLVAEHPVTHKPFLCIRGIREYHEHPQHSGDDWLLYRGQISLFSLVLSLWRVSIDLPHAEAVFHPGGVTINWVGREKL